MYMSEVLIYNMLKTYPLMLYNRRVINFVEVIVMIKFSPSLLSADYANMGEDIRSCLECGADYLHYDVMDGSFVSNINFGIPGLKSLRKCTDGFFDVHLMIERPVRYVEQFCKAGADLVNCHIEADTEENTHEALRIIKENGVKAGITIRPDSSPEAVLPFIHEVDLILIMTVVPGQGGQSFMMSQLDTIRKVREYINEMNPECELEVDGGINAYTAPLAIEAGANVLVSGSAFFASADRAAMVKRLKGE